MIEKNGKIYEIKECAGCWTVILKEGILSVEIKVPKEICETEEDLKLYIEKENIF